MRSACIFLVPIITCLPASEPATGLILSDPATIAAERAATPCLLAVRPNALRRQRALAEAQARGQPVPAITAWPEAQTVLRAQAGTKASAAAQMKAEAQAAASVSVVDNSLLAAFPPIRTQDSLNACVPFSVVYYALTYEVALAKGWDAKNGGDAFRFSPKWAYNLVNGGSDGGTTPGAVFDVLGSGGAVSWSTMPYVGNGSNPLNYRGWPTATPAVWRTALATQVPAGINLSNSIYINGQTEISLIKDLVANGRVLPFATQVLRWVQGTASGGAKVCPWLRSSQGSGAGHMMTIVGYDDGLWLDANGNGAQDAGEIGAFKVANSWGTSDWNAGFRWILYDAFLPVSAISGAPADRVAANAGQAVYWLTLAPAPKILAEITLNHSMRRDLTMAVGVAATGTPAPDINSYAYSTLFVGTGGPYAFSGDAPAMQSVTLTVDFGALEPQPAAARRFFVGVKDGGWSTDGLTVTACRLVKPDGSVIAQAASGLPLAVNNSGFSIGWIGIDAVMPGTSTNLLPVASPLSASCLEDASTTPIVLTGSDQDGTVTGYTITAQPANGTLSGSPPNLTYTPSANQNGSDSFSFTVTDNQGGVSSPATGTIAVASVNDAPTWIPGTDLVVAPGAGSQTFSGWATGILAGPADETAIVHGVPVQTVSFLVTSTPSSLFAVQPTLSADGTLTFTPGTTAGTATLQIVLRDSGGTANGGQDSSVVVTRTITITTPPVITQAAAAGTAVLVLP
jgi:hypothetical protein